MVKIEVDDINDNAPVFTPDEYNVTLQKNDPVGKIIVIVKALDSDSGVFGEVEYMMGKGNEDGKFAVDKDSGEITIYSALGQFPSTFQLEVIAKDKTGNKGEQNAIVNINVAFDPKESPIFDQSIYHFSVSEDASTFSSIECVLPSYPNACVFTFYGGTKRQPSLLSWHEVVNSSIFYQSLEYLKVLRYLKLARIKMKIY